MEAKTIQIFLPDGEPRGVRIAEITTRIVQAVAFPRTHLEKLAHREEVAHIGVYFLFGEGDGTAKPIVYIGQTEDMMGRLRSHHAKKEFWQSGVLIVSSTDIFTQAHIRYLEWYSIRKVKDAGRYDLDNDTQASKPHVTEPMEADIQDAFETAAVLLGTLGFPVFEPLTSKKDRKESDTFHCSGPNANGQGQLVEDGFVVFKGSVCRKSIVISAVSCLQSRQDALVDAGILIDAGESYTLKEDYLFNSPSAAAMIVLGRTANGWLEWKTTSGTTLRDANNLDGAKTDGETT